MMVLVLITGKLWTAPEILRENFPPPRGTQRGDVYSFSIICVEVLMRSEPFNFDSMTPRGISAFFLLFYNTSGLGYCFYFRFVPDAVLRSRTMSIPVKVDRASLKSENCVVASDIALIYLPFTNCILPVSVRRSEFRN